MVSTVLSADVLIFSDNFNTTNTGINDDLATRQSGLIAQTDWNTGGSVSASVSGNSMLVTNPTTSGDANTWLNYNFATDTDLLTGGKFTVSFDMTADDNYTVFFIGGDISASRPYIDSDTDFLFRPNSTSTSTLKDNGAATTGLATVGTGSKSYLYTVTTDDFDNGTAWSIDLKINGVDYDLNGGVAGNTFSGNWDGSSIYIGFTNRNDDLTFDNFAIYAVPEPSSLLLTFGGLSVLMLGLRRRA